MSGLDFLYAVPPCLDEYCYHIPSHSFVIELLKRLKIPGLIVLMKLVSTSLEKTVTLSFIIERYIVVGGYTKLALWSRGISVWLAIC